ncbi:Hg(II)-responsive transcriptional regulator [soil metagenome]
MGVLTIGAVAKQSDVNVETIRYYQRRGLLQEPDKPPQGFRRYSVETVKRIHFIKRAQELGFTLDEISELLRLDETTACEESKGMAQAKLRLIEAKIADLTKMKRGLGRLFRACESVSVGKPCPLIHSLLEG